MPSRTVPPTGATVTLLLVLLVAMVGLGDAAGKTGKTITLGESLSPDQRTELLAYFQADPDDAVIVVTEQDTEETMKGILDEQSGSVQGAFSSTALTCRDLGDGLDVTTRNITLVTPSMYAMALVTAGIGDAKLVVAAPDLSSALGMTALTGVFKTWEIAPCESGAPTEKRKRLALQELALTASIGQAFVAAGLPDGVQRASDLVLDTQKTIVTDHLGKAESIDKALLAQEQARGVAIPAELRGELIDLLLRLAKAKIDWSTFSAGWEIKRNEQNTRITMTGDGIAIRNARASATAQAAAAMTATARAAAAQTATAQAALTATAAARLALTATADAALQATADALATRQAAAALTATAAVPTPTPFPTPSPTPTPAPVAVAGTIAAKGDGTLAVKAAGARQATEYAVDPSAAIQRGGRAARFADLTVGDSVTLTVDGGSNVVRAIEATAAPVSLVGRVSGFWWLPVIALAGGLGIVLAGRRRQVEPFLVKRVPA